jgi:hypothetical protein
MQTICSANWSDLTLRKKACYWKRPKQLLEAGRIVAGRREEAPSAPIAGENQRTCWTFFSLSRKQGLQVLVSCVGITNMKLDGLPGPY